MLCYISCTNTKDYSSFYYRNGNTDESSWAAYGNVLLKPTFMHVFKVKQLIKSLKDMDYENGDETRYTYSVIPVLTYVEE